jgi:hypothetical protein
MRLYPEEAGICEYDVSGVSADSYQIRYELGLGLGLSIKVIPIDNMTSSITSDSHT